MEELAQEPEEDAGQVGLNQKLSNQELRGNKKMAVKVGNSFLMQKKKRKKKV